MEEYNKTCNNVFMIFGVIGGGILTSTFGASIGDLQIQVGLFGVEVAKLCLFMYVIHKIIHKIMHLFEIDTEHLHYWSHTVCVVLDIFALCLASAFAGAIVMVSIINVIAIGTSVNLRLIFVATGMIMSILGTIRIYTL